MHRIEKRLAKVTRELLAHSRDASRGDLFSEMQALEELGRTLKMFERVKGMLPDGTMRDSIADMTREILGAKSPLASESDERREELKTLQAILKMWGRFDGAEAVDTDPEEEARKISSLTWDTSAKGLMTDIELTRVQASALELMDDPAIAHILCYGGAGSGKSFIQAYKVVRDCLRHKAPCLIARNKFSDLKAGMIGQVLPKILELIAAANGQKDWKKWRIDGIPFARFSERSMGTPGLLEFATGGYIRFAGLSARDLSESGMDKVLAPSWLHVMMEEVSDIEYDSYEKMVSRIRHPVDGEINRLLMCENPPSIFHWTYTKFFEHKTPDGNALSDGQVLRQAHIMLRPEDNVEHLGTNYIFELSQLTGANYERFYAGNFQDTETGLVFKRIPWTESLPHPNNWERLVVYTDPTPLTGRDYSEFADFKASVLCGLFCGVTFVLDVRVIRGSTTDMLNNMKQLWDASPDRSITEVVMEKKQVPSDFKQVLNTFAQTTGWMCPVKMDIRHFTDKKASIETYLQPHFENGTIEFNEAFRNTDRGKEVQKQILKFSRKSSLKIHDDIPDAIMRADTYMRGRGMKRGAKGDNRQIVSFVTPAYVYQNN